MQINLLKTIVEDIAGKQANEIVDLLAGKKDVNEFLIAKKLRLTINQTRNILYKLSDAGLLSFTRKKDKRKGWYIYFWTLNSFKSLDLLEKKILSETSQLEHQLRNRKFKRFYYCKTCNVETGEENALLNDFICQECGQVYELSEQGKIIKELESKIIKLKKNSAVIKEEKNKIVEQEGKKRSIKKKKIKKKKTKKLKIKKLRKQKKSKKNMKKKTVGKIKKMAKKKKKKAKRKKR